MVDFHKTLKKDLNIESHYSIETELIPRDQEGYIVKYRCACIVPDFDNQKVKRVIFFIGNIANYINDSFSRIYSQEVFNKIIRIVISYLLTHEMIHVNQIQEGRLTKELFDDEKKIPYKERATEIEADSRALEIMKNCDLFTMEICKLVKERKSADSKVVEKLEECFNRKEK